MNFSEIKELISLVNDSKLTEFRMQEQQFELYLNKNQQCGASSRKEEVAYSPSAPVAAPQIQPTEVVIETLSSDPVASEGGHQIESPLVGVVYLKPNPDKPVFKQVGDQVKVGEVVCIIEAMKVMNEIVSDVNGEVTAIYVENEEVVEFGQPLIQIKEN